nr:retrotransposon Orf1 [Tanacetum cinerariifolium]
LSDALHGWYYMVFVTTVGDDVVIISSDKVEGSGDWNSPECQDTAGSKGKKVVNALSFYKMETDEIKFDENLISNEFAVKFCLDYEVKKGKKLVKKELIVSLKGELYFVKFIINPEEDDFKPRVIFGRSFPRLAHGVVDFGNVNFLRLYARWGKSNRNKKRAMKNSNLFNQDIRPSSSAGGHIIQEETEREALAIKISQKFALLKEKRPVIETMAYNDKYKKILDEIWRDKVELNGKIMKEEEEAEKRIKGEALKEKDDPGAFIFPIILEGKVNENALADTRSDINTMPYRIYETLGREEMKKIDRGITMINHTQTKAMGKLSDVLCQVRTPGKHDEEAGSRDVKSRYKTRLARLLPRHIYSPCIVNWDVLNQMGCDGEIEDMLRIRVREAESDEEIFTSVACIKAFNINEPIYAELCHKFYSTYEFDEVCADDELQSKKIIKFRQGGRAHSLNLLEFLKDWDSIKQLS